jgi:hypothetical protein
VVAELGDKNMSEHTWTRHAAINRTAGSCGLNDAITAVASPLGTAMTDHTPMAGHILKLLGNVFTQIGQCTATLRANFFNRLMNDVLARQMIG